MDRRRENRTQAVPKPVTSPASPKERRGRPKAKTPKKGRAPSRSRSSNRAASKSRAKPKAKAESEKKPPKPRTKSKTRRSVSRSRTREDSASEDEILIKNKRINKAVDEILAKEKLNEIIRRSVSKEIANLQNDNIRRSARVVLRHVTDGASSTTVTETRVTPKKAKVLQSQQETEFGGNIGAALSIIYGPLIILLLHLACTREQCTLSKFHIPRNWRVYLNTEAAGITVGFFLLQLILSALPIGRPVGSISRTGKPLYRCNGLLSLIITSGIVGGLWYLKYPVTHVYERYIPLLVSSAILGFLISLFAFIKGGRASRSFLRPGIGAKIYDFVAGREVNPHLFDSVNLKTVILRTGAIGTFILNALLVLKAYEVRHELSYTLLVYAGLYNLLIIDFFWFEEAFATTFEFLYELSGLRIIQGYLMYPFFPTLITKFLIQQKVELPIYVLVIIGVFTLIGYFIYRASNLQKAAFRKNPQNPALAHFETISTSRGKKILVSGWWGWVRHPNYLGDIIIHWALAATAGSTNAIPYAVALITTLLLLHRAKRVDRRCRETYQSAWDEYTRRVKYHILPRVY